MGPLHTILNFRRDCTDAVASQLIIKWVNLQLTKIGRMINLKIDSKLKTVHVELELEGETEPIHVEIPKYSIIREGETTFIELTEIQVSREWMNVLVEKYLKEKRFEIPSALKIVL